MREFTFPGRVYLAVMAAMAIGLTLGGELPAAQSANDAAPLSGDALQRKLAEPVGVSWSRVPLGDVVASLTRNTRVCIWLDRRVDRQKSVEWTSSGKTVRETIEQLADAQGLAAAWIGSVAYVGPRAAVAGLPTLITRRSAEIALLPPKLRTRFAERSPLAWDELAEPRGELTKLATQAGWSIENETVVPHDLLLHFETPPLTLNERLSLLTAGFGLTYQLNPATNKITLGPWPADLADAANSTTLPKPKASASGTVKPAEPPAGVPGRQVYTLRVQGVPLSKLIDVLKQKHSLKIRTDDKAITAAGLTLEKATSVDVQNATLEALLEQAAVPLGLHARQDGDTVVIEPKK
jgi:hypothetical protein